VFLSGRSGTHTLRNQAVTQLGQRGSRPSAHCRSIPAQTNGPHPKERARGDTRSLASRGYPGQPGWLVQIVERKDTSNAQADSMGGRLRPKTCLYGGLHPFRAGAGARSEEHQDWLPIGTRRSSHPNPVAGDGLSRARPRPITRFQALDGVLVSAWLKRKGRTMLPGLGTYSRGWREGWVHLL
jgi:hypothetical protein